MAIKETVVSTYISDLSGAEGAVTVHFAFEDANWAIELTKEERKAFVQALAPYTDKARRVGGKSPSGKQAGQRAGKSGPRASTTRHGASGSGSSLKSAAGAAVKTTGSGRGRRLGEPTVGERVLALLEAKPGTPMAVRELASHLYPKDMTRPQIEGVRTALGRLVAREQVVKGSKGYYVTAARKVAQQPAASVTSQADTPSEPVSASFSPFRAPASV